MRRRTSIRLTVMTLGAGLLGGCRRRAGDVGGSTGSIPTSPPGGAEPTSVSVSPGDEASGDGTSGPQLLTPSPSLDDLLWPRARSWDSWRLIDPATVEVTFISGPADCEGVYAQVVETDQDVTINVSLGVLPSAGPCEDIALESAVRVTLGQDLGDRRVRQDAAESADG
jgi:lipoprotein